MQTTWGEDTMGEDTTTRHHAEHTQGEEILLAWSRVRSRGFGMIRIGTRIGIRIRIRPNEFWDCHMFTPCSGETMPGEIRGLRHDEVRVAQGFGHRVLGTGTWGIG